MKKSHWMLAGFMLFNTACVVESAFPGWSALYTSVLEFTGGAFELFAVVSDHWINRHGVYFPTYPDFQFVGWSDAAVYLTLGLLVRLLVKSELELRSLRRERREREAAAFQSSRAKTAVPAEKTFLPGRVRLDAGEAVRETDGGAFEDEREGRATVTSPAGMPALIQLAIANEGLLAFDYDDRRLRHTRRRVRPYGVISYRGKLYMKGFCLLRGEERTFMLSRMRAPRILPGKYAGRKGA
ncbi:MAG: WYL domain-containing protein [Spirochaetes bacterium]|jgi:hypothetical protein|nr:WYL domain-containing protein [Spirochaetota bacterium]